MNRHLFRGSSVNRDSRDASFERDTVMRVTLRAGTDRVLQNIRLGLTNDIAKEEAIALFRTASCLLPPDPNRRPDGAVFKGTGEPVVSKRRADLRCEHWHALYEYHGLEPGVGHRILCPVCDRDYIRELVANRK